MDIRLSISVSPPLLLALLLPERQLVPASASLLVPQATAMPLPLEAIYSSKDELYSSIQAWAAQHYYAFRIGRSNKIHQGPRIKIFYNCDRCRPAPLDNYPQNYPQARKRQTTTRKTGCQFSIVALEYTDTQ